MTIWTLLVIGFWISVALILFRIALTVILYAFVFLLAGVAWVVDKIKGE